MNLVELLQIASSEEKAEEFLREIGLLKTFDSCPFCHAKNIGRIRRNFYKCYKCKKEWSVRKIDKSVKFANGKVYINGIEGFWSYAKERLLKFHGVSKDNFVYYLKELEFRYNFRENILSNYLNFFFLCYCSILGYKRYNF
jgi:hypothetical protein